MPTRLILSLQDIRPKTFRLLSLSAVAVVASLTIGCEKDAERQVFAAQACLDSASVPDDAERCVALVEGVETKDAYLVRCSANFLYQGFTGARAAQAFEKLGGDDDDGGNPMATTMAFMVFAKNSPNHTADKAMTNCQKSGVTSMVQLATLAKLATFVADPTGTGAQYTNPDGEFDETKIEDAINELLTGGTPSQLEDFGNIAESASGTFCTEGSTYKETKICTNLESAISGGAGDQEEIGRQLLNLLKN